MILLLIAALYAALTWMVPVMYDDFTFKTVYESYYRANGGNVCDAYTSFVAEVRDNDNGRISNMLSPIVTLTSHGRCVFACLTGLCFAAIVAMCSLLSTGATRNVVAIGWAWLLCLVCLPLRNNIFVIAYALNYIYAAMFTLAAIWLMIRCQQGRHRSTWLYVVAVPVLFLAGGWHEGFAVATLCGLLAWGVVSRNRDARWWALLVLYAVVMLAFALSPGLLSRGGRQVSFNVVNMARICGHQFLVVLTAAMTALWLLSRKRRVLLTLLRADAVLVICGVSALAGLGIGMFTVESGRVAFWPQLCAVVYIMRIVYLTYPAWYAPTVARRVVAVAVCVLCGALTMAIIDRQHKLTMQYSAILDLYHDGDSTTVYYDITRPEDEPLWTLGIPTSSQWIEPFNYTSMEQELGSRISVVPTALRCDLVSAVGRRIDGDASLMLTSDGVLYTTVPADDYYVGTARIRYTLDDGTVREYDNFAIAFHDTAMHQWLYIKPLNRLLLPSLDPARIARADMIGYND